MDNLKLRGLTSATRVGGANTQGVRTELVLAPYNSLLDRMLSPSMHETEHAVQIVLLLLSMKWLP